MARCVGRRDRRCDAARSFMRDGQRRSSHAVGRTTLEPAPTRTRVGMEQEPGALPTGVSGRSTQWGCSRGKQRSSQVAQQRRCSRHARRGRQSAAGRVRRRGRLGAVTWRSGHRPRIGARRPRVGMGRMERTLQRFAPGRGACRRRRCPSAWATANSSTFSSPWPMASLYYDGFCNSTLWPLYHDTVVPPAYHRKQFEAYRRVNQRFAITSPSWPRPGATVWVHDYQLQLVPAMLRALRPDLTIALLPAHPVPAGRAVPAVARGVSRCSRAARRRPRRLPDRRAARATSSPRASACSATRSMTTTVILPDEQGGRRVRVGGVPDLDRRGVHRRARASTPAVQERAPTSARRARQPRTAAARRRPARLHQGHRHPHEGVRRAASTTGCVRRRQRRDGAGRHAEPRDVEDYQRIRDEVELIVGRANGRSRHGRRAPRSTTCTSTLAARGPRRALRGRRHHAGHAAARRHEPGRPRSTSRPAVDGGGALVLSEFAGAAHELREAFQVNPHDADGMKRVDRGRCRLRRAEERDAPHGGAARPGVCDTTSTRWARLVPERASRRSRSDRDA